MAVLGLISDTHALLRPEAVAALRGSDLIAHAGDVGKPEVLDGLRDLAPLYAVRGNIDRADWADALPFSQTFEFAGAMIHMVHDKADIELDPLEAGVDLVVTGHSHKPLIEARDDVLYVNPGSAGPRRFKLPVTVARVVIANGSLSAELVQLEIA